MNKGVILLSLFISLLATKPMIMATESRNQRISQAQSAWKTFKKDMSCLFSRTKKCTPEQKKRIAAEAVGLVITITALTGIGAGFWFRTKRGKGEESTEDITNLISQRIKEHEEREIKREWEKKSLAALQKNQETYQRNRNDMIRFLKIFTPFFVENKKAIIGEKDKAEKWHDNLHRDLTQLKNELVDKKQWQSIDNTSKETYKNLLSVPYYYLNIFGQELTDKFLERLPEDLLKKFGQKS